MTAYWIIGIVTLLTVISCVQVESELKEERSFYQSKEWRALRQRVFRAYGYNCMRCGITHDGMHIDHIIARSVRPDLELDFNNLQVMCAPHNIEKSNTDFTDYRGTRVK